MAIPGQTFVQGFLFPALFRAGIVAGENYIFTSALGATQWNAHDGAVT